MLDLTTIATLLGVAAPGVVVDGPRVPSWWGDDESASTSSIEAARQLGFVVADVS